MSPPKPPRPPTVVIRLKTPAAVSPRHPPPSQNASPAERHGIPLKFLLPCAICWLDKLFPVIINLEEFFSFKRSLFLHCCYSYSAVGALAAEGGWSGGTFCLTICFSSGEHFQKFKILPCFCRAVLSVGPFQAVFFMVLIHESVYRCRNIWTGRSFLYS